MNFFQVELIFPWCEFISRLICPLRSSMVLAQNVWQILPGDIWLRVDKGMNMRALSSKPATRTCISFWGSAQSLKQCCICMHSIDKRLRLPSQRNSSASLIANSKPCQSCQGRFVYGSGSLADKRQQRLGFSSWAESQELDIAIDIIQTDNLPVPCP